MGIGSIAIMPNDTATYREDSSDNMKAFAAKHRFSFPYVIDETQEVARAYGAQCTPDFFRFNAQDELQYRGRLDASRTTKADKRTRSKWSRVMRYAAAYKPDSEALDQFIKRKGGINACAARFSRCLGRTASFRTAG